MQYFSNKLQFLAIDVKKNVNVFAKIAKMLMIHLSTCIIT